MYFTQITVEPLEFIVAQYEWIAPPSHEFKSPTKTNSERVIWRIHEITSLLLSKKKPQSKKIGPDEFKWFHSIQKRYHYF